VMKETPILMTPENAQKCHKGTKTQTRRIVKLPLRCPAHGVVLNSFDPRGEHDADILVNCPYGVVGDWLWVREPYAWPGEEVLLYRGCPSDSEIVEKWKHDKNCPQVKWTPSIHMPKWACRTWLEITEVRVQRLREISEEDCYAEGLQRGMADDRPDGLRIWYRELWESINGPGSWDENPWVWAISFRKVAR